MTRTALWYTPVGETGGVSRHVLDVARTGLPAWRLVVLCPEGPLARELRARGTAVLTGPVGAADGPRAAIPAVRRVLRRLGPDVLHTHLAFADLVGTAAAVGVRSGRGLRVRHVSTEHGIAGVRGLYQATALEARVKRAAHRARLRRTDRVIAVSESTREQVRAQWGHGTPVTVIRNAVERPAAPPSGRDRPEGGLRVLSLARLAPEKRIDRLLEAFALVHAEHPAARLTIAGEGPSSASLRSRARDLGLDGAIAWPGHVDAAAAMGSHDVVVQLSAWENLSYTLLDAVAHGLGVVASDVGGNAEIVPSRCLVDPADARAVARAITAQGTTPGVRPGHDGAGAPVGTGAPLTQMCRAIADVYGEVMA